MQAQKTFKAFAPVVAIIAGGVLFAGGEDNSTVELTSVSGVTVNVTPEKMSLCATEFSPNCYRPETHTVQVVMMGGVIEHLPIPVEDVKRMGL